MGCSIPVGENSEQPIPAEPVPARRAAVLGSPVAHSRSPQLHLAAYRALGLADWTYDRIECSADQLPSVVSAFGPEWVGVSVTMPGKFAALRFATERTERAELVGSANTLVRVPSGWRADNTDIDGVAGALGNRDDLRRAIILGSGGTAPSAVVAGLASPRSPWRPARPKSRQAVELGSALGVDTGFGDLADPGLSAAIGRAEVLVSTIPADAAAGYASRFAAVPLLLDAIYEPWPTPLAQVIGDSGAIVGGLQMLLHQAFSQVEQFTGRQAPRQQMAAVLG